MGQSRYREKDLEFFFQHVEWADMEDEAVWFTGNFMRFAWGEKHTKKFADTGRVLVRRYGNRLIYSAPTHWKGKLYIPDDSLPAKYRREMEERFYQVEHGRAVTKEIIRLWRSSMADSQIIHPREFIGLGVKPDWAFRYQSSQFLLLGEHITQDYFYRTSMLKLKLRKYQECLPSVEARFQGKTSAVLVVMDVKSSIIRQFLGGLSERDPRFFFVAKDDFLAVRLGKQLSTSIYIWGRDGATYPLGNDE